MSKIILVGVNFIFTIKYLYSHVNFLSNILWFAKLLRSNFRPNVKNTFRRSKSYIYNQTKIIYYKFLSNILWFAKLLRSNFNVMSKILLVGVNSISTVKKNKFTVNFLSNILWLAKLIRSNFKCHVKNTFISGNL